MKTKVLALSSIAFLVVFLSGSIAFTGSLVAKIDFPFKAAGKELPAGKYMIKLMDVGDLEIMNLDTGKAIACSYLTRLASRDDGKALLVFDKVGDQYYLSEIFEADIDGFALKGVEQKHTHVKVPASKS